MDAASLLSTLSRTVDWREALALRWQRLGFRARAGGLQLGRAWRNALDAAWHGPPPRREAPRRVDDPEARLAFVRATSITRLWTHADGRQWRLTAGKVHNLRVAARLLDGLAIPADTVFSFWGAIGRTSARRGFVAGRELREGCLVASTGGGLCQLANALYDVALQAGARIVERHAHSRVVPGSQAERGRDATVFWNYLDLRFSLPEPWELEVRLDADHLVVKLRALSPPLQRVVMTSVATATTARAADAAPARDCADCSRSACPDRQRPGEPPGQPLLHAAVPAGWPEHLAWTQAQAPARLLAAEDVSGWRVQASRVLAWWSRRQPARWRRSVLAVHDARAHTWARMLPAECTELAVPIDWLAALACDGALQGRRYSVLMTRPPLAWLQQELDEAAARLPAGSLSDFRASPARVGAEMQALRHAARLVTPHAALADRLRAHLPAEVVPLTWQVPKARKLEEPEAPSTGGQRVLLPASAMARSGVHELVSACWALDRTLNVLGAAREDTLPRHGPSACAVADPQSPWRDVAVVALPSWVSTSPRLLLQALARGLPVVATPACGLRADTPGLHLVPAGDVAALTRALSLQLRERG